MTVSVRPWPEIAADLRMGHAHGIGGRLDNEAAVAGDALAAKLAAVHASLPDCPTCGGTAAIGPPADGRLSSGPCPDCDDGKVSVEQMVTELSALAVVVAAVHTALDRYDADRQANVVPVVALGAFRATIAKAVER